MGATLSVQDLAANYGLIQAVKGISFKINQDEIVTLIDASGVGKMTALYTVSDLVKTKSGSVSFCDYDLLSTEPHKILGLGAAYVPEDHRVFFRMTVMESLQMGTYIRNDVSGIPEDYDVVFERLSRLKERRKQAVGTPSGGEQQMLAVDRVLMGRLEMLLLDESFTGLSSLLAGEIFEIISDVDESGVTVLLVEWNAEKTLEIADYAYVLGTGKIVMSGGVLELADNEEVRRAYPGD